MNSRLDFLAEIQFFEHLETFGNEVEKGLLKARRSVDAAHLRESANEVNGIGVLERHLQSGFGAVPRLRALTVDRPSLSELLPEVESVIFKFENAMKQAETRLRELGVLPPVQVASACTAIHSAAAPAQDDNAVLDDCLDKENVQCAANERPEEEVDEQPVDIEAYLQTQKSVCPTTPQEQRTTSSQPTEQRTPCLEDFGLSSYAQPHSEEQMSRELTGVPVDADRESDIERDMMEAIPQLYVHALPTLTSSTLSAPGTVPSAKIAANTASPDIEAIINGEMQVTTAHRIAKSLAPAPTPSTDPEVKKALDAGIALSEVLSSEASNNKQIPEAQGRATAQEKGLGQLFIPFSSSPTVSPKINIHTAVRHMSFEDVTFDLKPLAALTSLPSEAQLLAPVQETTLDPPKSRVPQNPNQGASTSVRSEECVLLSTISESDLSDVQSYVRNRITLVGANSCVEQLNHILSDKLRNGGTQNLFLSKVEIASALITDNSNPSDMYLSAMILFLVKTQRLSPQHINGTPVYVPKQRKQ